MPAPENLLLFGARRRVYLADRLRPLARNRGVRLLGCDTDHLDPLRFHVDDFFTLPSLKDPAFMDALAAAAVEYRIGSLLPWNDTDIRFLNARRDALALAGVRLLLPPSEVVELFCDKRSTATWAAKEEVRQPRVVHPDAPVFPLVAKPRFGQGSVGVCRIDNSIELSGKPYVLDSEGWVLQEWIDGIEYTVDVGIAGRARPLFISPRRRIKTRGGEVLIARIEQEPPILNYVAGLCERLDFHGIFNVQVFLRGEEVVLIEFNPRFGGGTDLTIEAGADIPMYLLELHLHGRIISDPPHIRDRLTMTRYFQADFFMD